MKKLDLTQLSNEELQIEAKKRKSGYNLFKFVIGIMIGSAIFSTIMKGFSFFTLLPVFFIPLAFTTKTSYDEVNKEIESRN
jgi:riboflavin transporter FmnP